MDCAVNVPHNGGEGNIAERGTYWMSYCWVEVALAEFTLKSSTKRTAATQLVINPVLNTPDIQLTTLEEIS